jgi:hypothetical protein
MYLLYMPERDDLKIRYDLQAKDLSQQQQKVVALFQYLHNFTVCSLAISTNNSNYWVTGARVDTPGRTSSSLQGRGGCSASFGRQAG